MLRHVGIKDKNILEANDGDQALKIIQSETEKKIIVLILLDWNMPRLTGIEVLQKLKEDDKLQNIFVLMITAENNQEQITRAIEKGADNYIIKPFKAKTLEEKMLNIINPPQYIEAIKEGEELLDQGNYQKAIDIFQDVLKIKPDSASVRILMGKAYEEMKDFERARQLYEEAIEKNPEYLRAYNTLTDFLIKIDDKKAALNYLEKAAEISPVNPQRHLMIGKLALECRKDTEKAEKAFRKALKQSPEIAHEVAEIYLENRNAKKAEEFFRSSLTQNQSVHIYNRLGIALRKQRKWKKAIEEYQKALKIDPNDEVIFYNMGMAYLEGDKMAGGKKNDAIICLKNALKINPNFEEAKKALKDLRPQDE